MGVLVTFLRPLQGARSAGQSPCFEGIVIGAEDGERFLVCPAWPSPWFDKPVLSKAGGVTLSRVYPDSFAEGRKGRVRLGFGQCDLFVPSPLPSTGYPILCS